MSIAVALRAMAAASTLTASKTLTVNHQPAKMVPALCLFAMMATSMAPNQTSIAAGKTVLDAKAGKPAPLIPTV